ncbi:MAG: sigma-70 family RNA polymerase sigma factor [Bacilli bacterium]|nr:sigma-70 family RNA polymerase sigma factor [Bacilli bacterium]
MSIEEYVEKLEINKINSNIYDKLVRIYGNDIVNDFFEKSLSGDNKNLIDNINKILEKYVEEDLVEENEEDELVTDSIGAYLKQIKPIRILKREEEQKYGKMIMDNKDIFKTTHNTKNSIFTKIILNNRKEFVLDLEKIFSSINNEKDQKEILSILNNYYYNNFWNENKIDRIIRQYLSAYNQLSKKVGIPSIEELNKEISNIDINNTFNNYSNNKKIDNIELLKNNLIKYTNYMYARNKMIYHNLKLAFSIAKHANIGNDFKDDLSSANLGLIKAVDRFDYTRGNKFSSYAIWWILQSIYRTRADTGDLIRVPVYLHEEMAKVKRFIGNYEMIYGKKPDIETISKELNLTNNKVKNILSIINEYMTPASLNRTIGEDEESELMDIVIDNNNETENNTEQNNLKKLIEESLKSLTEKEKRVIMLRYGIRTNQKENMTIKEICDYFGTTTEYINQLEKETLIKIKKGEGVTLREVGECYGVTRERIRQIETRALEKLRVPFKKLELKIYM